METSSSTSSFKSRALAVAGFIALVVAGDQLCGRAALQVARSSEFRFSRLYRGGVDADIAVVGNSRAVAALPPHQIAGATGRSVFSMAYNGLGAEVSLALVADYLERNRRPETIIAEVSFVAQPTGINADFKLWARSSERLEALIATYKPRVGAAARLSPLFRANSEMLLRAAYYLRADDQRWQNRGRIDEASYRALLAADAEPLKTRPAHLRALREMIALCDQAGVELILVAAPYLPATRADFGVDPWLAELTDQLAPAEIVDLSGALGTRHGFADRIHTNELGARRVVSELAPQL